MLLTSVEALFVPHHLKYVRRFVIYNCVQEMLLKKDSKSALTVDNI